MTDTGFATEYITMWDDFAKRKAVAYLGSKYDLGNIVGLVGCAREHEIMRLLNLQPDDAFLDVGCASGHQVFTAGEKAARAVGVDVGEPFIELAKEHAKQIGSKNTEFFLTDGKTLPFPDNTFDKTLCSEVIEHLIDPSAVISEIYRVLKPGGTAVFTVPNWNSRGTIWKRITFGFKEPPFTPITEFTMSNITSHGDAHVRQFSLKTFTELIESYGFKANYVGGAGYIDGPKSGRVIQITNQLAFMRWLTFSIEKICARLPGFKALSRHVVLRATKVEKV